MVQLISTGVIVQLFGIQTSPLARQQISLLPKTSIYRALKDWMQSHSVSLDSPSGLSKTWVLLQTASILYETGSQIVVPIPGERTGFSVTRLNNVKNFADLVAKAKSSAISNLGKDDIETVFLNLMKKQNFPFFASERQRGKSRPKTLKSFLSARLEPRDFDATIIRLTRIRDNHDGAVKQPNSKNEGGKKIPVPRDGSQADSLILFVHTQTPQTDPAESVDGLDKTQIETATGSKPSEGPTQLFRNTRNVWRLENEDFDRVCVHFTRRILHDYRQITEIPNSSNVDMSVWKKIIALLLLKTDELVRNDKLEGSGDAVSTLIKLSKTETWTKMLTSANKVVQESLIENLKPIFVSLHDTGKMIDANASLKLWIELLNETDPFENIFGTKTGDGNGSRTAIRCPICAIGYFDSEFLKKHMDEHQAGYSAPIPPEHPGELICQVCFHSNKFRYGPFKDKYSLSNHFIRFHEKDLAPGVLSFVPGTKLYKCPLCLSSNELYTKKTDMKAHLLTTHRDLSQLSTSSSKRPMEESEESSKSKRIASSQDSAQVTPHPSNR